MATDLALAVAHHLLVFALAAVIAFEIAAIRVEVMVNGRGYGMLP